MVVGHHHHVAGPYLIRFAQEASWREDHRREANGTQVDRVVALAMANRRSVDFCGYWQRALTDKLTPLLLFRLYQNLFLSLWT